MSLSPFVYSLLTYCLWPAEDNAFHYLRDLFQYFPEYEDFTLYNILTTSGNKDAVRQTYLSYQNDFRTILKEKGWAVVKDGSASLRLTDTGRNERESIIETIADAKAKREADKNKYSFNDYANVLLKLLAKHSSTLNSAVILSEIRKEYPYLSIPEVVNELDRLELINTGTDPRGKHTYILKQPVKNKCNSCQ